MNIATNNEMEPLDQTNRNWREGNCYYVALEFIKDSEELRSKGAIPKNASVHLVHGLLDSQRTRLKHAWIEIDDRVIDHSNYQSINEVGSEYYTANSALPVRRFTRAEADALLGTLKAKDGGLPIGYWGDLPDETVDGAMSNYQESNGVFVSGVRFSDPTDSANQANLIFKDGQGAGDC